MTPIVLSTTSYVLIALAVVAAIMIFIDTLRSRNKKTTTKTNEIYDSEVPVLPEAPGPKPWPIIGSLHLLRHYELPYMAFADLAKIYGQVFKMRMGSFPCLVVNGLENIKDVLITKGHHFDSRPNFVRYHTLFCGDKENSLAFCDWSDLQKSRRETLRGHTFPRAFTPRYEQLNATICDEMENMMKNLDCLVKNDVKAKPLILSACANIFTHYFCSKRFDMADGKFVDLVENFDKVFYEVNQGYAADFMPFLMPLHKWRMTRMTKWSHKIRDFVNKEIIGERFTGWSGMIPENDYVDCLINHVRTDAQPKMFWDTGLFALEDIIGGHSAVGNLIVKVLGFLVTRPEIQEIAQREIDQADVNGRAVGLEHRSMLPYVEAIILESIRLIASPIVPHVCNHESSIAGYKVEKGTFIFLNNYELHMSDKLWKSPMEFMPERFVQNGRISKPDHFLPFGGGRRSCMGYKMVQYIGFSMLATILKNFTISPTKSDTYNVPLGNLALPEECFALRFDKR